MFVAGGLTSLPAFKRSVTDTDLGKTVDCKAPGGGGGLPYGTDGDARRKFCI